MKLPSDSTTNFTFPFALVYTESIDPSFAIITDIASKCLGSPQTDLTIHYKLTVGVRVFFVTISPTISNSLSFSCPIDANDLEVRSFVPSIIRFKFDNLFALNRVLLKVLALTSGLVLVQARSCVRRDEQRTIDGHLRSHDLFHVCTMDTIAIYSNQLLAYCPANSSLWSLCVSGRYPSTSKARLHDDEDRRENARHDSAKSALLVVWPSQDSEWCVRVGQEAAMSLHKLERYILERLLSSNSYMRQVIKMYYRSIVMNQNISKER